MVSTPQESGSLAGLQDTSVPILKPKVVPLPVKPVNRAVQRTIDAVKPRNWIAVSALACIALPTLICALYLTFVATERYAVETQFAVRGQDVATVDAAGLLGALGGSPTQTTSDSYIITDYLISTQLVGLLDEQVDLRAMYTRPGVDFWSRLDSDASIEDLTAYWQRRTNVFFDATKSTITLEVSAFLPEDASVIAQEATRLASVLVNRLSEEARTDALRGATADVERAEFRLRVIREEMQRFREEQSIADPVIGAGSAQELIAQLQSEIARIDTELTSARTFMNDDAPSIVFLTAQKEALQTQLASAQAAIGDQQRNVDGDAGARSSVAGMISGFEELTVEREFAQQAYTAAMASLERARVEADRTHRYLAVFVDPRVPEDHAYPNVLKGTGLIFLFCAILWVIGVLLFFGIREHAT